MKAKRFVLASMISVSLMTAVGCENLPGGKQEQGTVIGGVGGAAAGAAIDKDNRARGAIIGGALGAAGGWLIGKEMKKNDQKEAEDVDRRAQEKPARPEDVNNSNTADLNRDGYVTLDEVMAMQKAGLNDDEIVRRLAATGQVFTLSQDQEDRLRDAGVSRYVIREMLDLNRGEAQPAAGGERISD